MKRLTISVILAVFAYAVAEDYLHYPLTEYLIQNFPLLRPALAIPAVDHSVAGLIAVALHLVDWFFWLFLLWPALVVGCLYTRWCAAFWQNAAWILFVMWLGSKQAATQTGKMPA
jgi:hypothetical protein